MNGKAFIKDAFIISAGGFISKIIGAAYRIPLAGIIGSKGLGLYQLVFPFYCLLLTVSACGITSALSKMVAGEGETGGYGVFRSALKLFSTIGFLGGVIMVALSLPLSSLQGEPRLCLGYVAIAPAVFFSSRISVYRGYFQGKNYMLPTACSEVCEQGVKVIFALVFAYIFRRDVYTAVNFALLSVSLSEGAALLFLRLTYSRIKFVKPLYRLPVGAGEVLKNTLPVTLSSIILPLSSLADSVLAVRLLSRYFSSAVSLYGILTGGAITVINLPVSVCYGFAAAVIPKISSAEARSGKSGRQTLFSLAVTAAIAFPCAVALYLFAPAATLIFPSFSGEEKEIFVRLIKILSISAFTLSCAQTLSACLTGKGLSWYGAFSCLVAVALKTAFYLLFLSQKNGVECLAHAVNVCYLSLFVVNLFMNLVVKRRKSDDNHSRLRRGRGRFDGEGSAGYPFGRQDNT